ncbi:MAG: hypothetical protein ACR2NX_09595 [Chthoniobacterales bacterium]
MSGFLVILRYSVLSAVIDEAGSQFSVGQILLGRLFILAERFCCVLLDASASQEQ